MNKDGFKSQNFIILYIRNALGNMLADFGLWNPVNPEWQVVRANQPTIQAMQDKTVYFDIISKRRIGVQGTKPIKENGQWWNETSWYEEMLVQVSAFKRRDVNTDSAQTLTSSDVVSYLQACVNANRDMGSFHVEGGTHSYFGGVEGISVVRSSDLREIDYETDSGLKDKLPQFDFLIIVKQRLLKNVPEIANIEVETKRI